MKVTEEKYTYVTDVDEETNQYGTVDFSDVEYVEARYVKSETAEFRGNPCIEALPRPRTKDECNMDFFRPINGYSAAEVQNMSSEKRANQLRSLRLLRLPMMYDYDLEREMYGTLLMSYCQRKQFFQPGIPVYKTFDERKLKSEAYSPECGKLVTDKYSSVTGFSLLGGSGTGKSSSIDILKSHYPQVIHHPQTSGHLTQIVYLEVTCPANSNFNVLYEAIGAEVDKALGYTTAPYSNLIQRSSNKFSVVKNLLENFCVGIIIFDEIQEIAFTNTKTNSFSTLVTLSEMSGCAIAVSGLEEAYEKMFKKVYTGRRAGMVISTNRYCYDEDAVDTILDMLFLYQWFDKKIIFDEATRKAMFKYTGGRIDQIITLYMYMHVEYLLAPEDARPAVNADYVSLCVSKYYGNMKDLIESEQKYHKKHGDFDQQILDESEKAKKRLDERLSHSTDTQKEMNERLAKELSDNKTFVEVQQGVMINVKHSFSSFSDNQIMAAFKLIWNDKNNRKLNTHELSEKVCRQLLTPKPAETVVKKKPSKKAKNAAVAKMDLAAIFNQQ